MRKLLIILTLILSSCTQLGTKTATGNSPETLKLKWREHQQALKKIHSWNIKGRIGFKTTNNAQSATFKWQQEEERFKLHLAGALGLGSMNLEGSPAYIRLQQANGRIIQSNNPEALLQTETGWILPISHISPWLLGHPGDDKRKTTQVVLNQSGQLSRFNHSTWQIQYSKYHLVNNLDLPHKLIISNNEVKVTIIIKDWVLN